MAKSPTVAAVEARRGGPAVGSGITSISSGCAFSRSVRRARPKKSTWEISDSSGVTVSLPGLQREQRLAHQRRHQVEAALVQLLGQRQAALVVGHGQLLGPEAVGARLGDRLVLVLPLGEVGVATGQLELVERKQDRARRRRVVAGKHREPRWRCWTGTSVPNGELFPSTDTGRARCYERTDHLDLRLGS